MGAGGWPTSPTATSSRRDDRGSGPPVGLAEIEVELKPAGDGERLLTVIGKRLRRPGQSVQPSVLQASPRPGDRPRSDSTPAGTVGALVADYLPSRSGKSSAATSRRGWATRCTSSGSRSAGPAARVASSGRSSTQTGGELEPELVWLAGLLGEVRDRDILRANDSPYRSPNCLPRWCWARWPPRSRPPAAGMADHLSRVTEAINGDRYASLVRQAHALADRAAVHQAGASRPPRRLGRSTGRTEGAETAWPGERRCRGVARRTKGGEALPVRSRDSPLRRWSFGDEGVADREVDEEAADPARRAPGQRRRARPSFDGWPARPGPARGRTAPPTDS